MFYQIDALHTLIVCGKSLTLWRHSQLATAQPIYAPDNLQRLINLGKIDQVKFILHNLVESAKSLKSDKNESLFAQLYKTPSRSELELRPIKFNELVSPPSVKLEEKSQGQVDFFTSYQQIIANYRHFYNLAKICQLS